MAANVVTWEHLVAYLVADARQQAPFLQQMWPGRQFPKYAALSLMPQLDYYGQQGWELVSIQPVDVGSNGDILIHAGQAISYSYTYLCVFKRQK